MPEAVKAGQLPWQHQAPHERLPWQHQAHHERVQAFASLRAKWTRKEKKRKEKKRKEKTTPFGVNLMRSQVLYRAAQAKWTYTHTHT